MAACLTVEPIQLFISFFYLKSSMSRYIVAYKLLDYVSLRKKFVLKPNKESKENNLFYISVASAHL